MGSYRERLYIPVSYWVLAVPVVVLVGGEAIFVASNVTTLLCMAVLAVIILAFLLNWGSATVEVTGGVLRAGKETMALAAVSEAISLDERQATLLRGPRADPAAYILLRPYLKRAVYVGIAEPAGSVPYWLVTTRHPDELAAAIQRAHQADDRESVG